MYFANWDRFVQACSTLYDQADLERTYLAQPRYSLRWRHDQGLLVIKVTDPHNGCIKFKTRSTVYLNRFDAFNRAMMTKFQNRKLASDKPAAVASQETSDAPETATTTGSLHGQEGEPAGASASATPKKKKKGKKKAKA